MIQIIENYGHPGEIGGKGWQNICGEDDVYFQALRYIPDLPQVIWKVQQIIERRIIDRYPAPVYKVTLRQSRFKALEPLQAEVQHINIVLLCQNVEDEVEPVGYRMSDPVRCWYY